MSELGLAVSGMNLLTQMAKGLLEAHTQLEREKIYGEFRERLMELHERILSAQAQMQDLLNAKVEAEEKLKTYENWEAERAKYALQEPATAVFVYALKPEPPGEQPAHWICPKCYEDRKKSILQAHPNIADKARFDGKWCPQCKTLFKF